MMNMLAIALLILSASAFSSSPSPSASVSSPSSPPSCPTITSTTSVCSSCIRIQCMSTSTVTVARGLECPAAVPTSFTALGCDVECPGGCAGTLFEVVTASGETEGSETEEGTDDDTATCEGCVNTQTVEENGARRRREL